eukprot:2530193-Rhodomonas_salina.1
MLDFHHARKANFESVEALSCKLLHSFKGKAITLKKVQDIKGKLSRKLQILRAALVIVKSDLRAIFWSIRPYNYD